MTITSIIENTSQRGLPVEHGLSLHIAMEQGSVLFDMGQSHLLLQNAETLGIDLKEVDLAVLSHGHYDHGGGLQAFLSVNDKAKVYVHREAFRPHYSLRETGLRYIGLDQELRGDSRLVFCGDRTEISSSIQLFAGVIGDCCRPVGNRLLYGPEKTQHDDFCDEQNLLITEGTNLLLVAGCAHKGIVNILRRAEAVVGKAPTHVLAGMHLVKSGLSERDVQLFTERLAKELKHYQGTKFYTMHCTGEDGFARLKAIMGDQIDYLACGDKIDIK